MDCFCEKFCNQEHWKIAQSGHTGRRRFFLKKISNIPIANFGPKFTLIESERDRMMLGQVDGDRI